MTDVVLVGKPGCHLCDDAELVVSGVCGDLGIPWRRVSIHDDPALADAYWDTIPVLLIDGVCHDQIRVDAQRLRTRLAGVSG